MRVCFDSAGQTGLPSGTSYGAAACPVPFVSIQHPPCGMRSCRLFYVCNVRPRGRSSPQEEGPIQAPGGETGRGMAPRAVERRCGCNGQTALRRLCRHHHERAGRDQVAATGPDAEPQPCAEQDQPGRCKGEADRIDGDCHIVGGHRRHQRREPMHGTYRYTRVYSRLPSGTWKITNFEATRVGPAPPPREKHQRSAEAKPGTGDSKPQ